VSKLEQETALGREAENAYNGFIKPFIDSKKIALFDLFQTIDIKDVEALVEARRTIATLNALETEVKKIMDTGTMASIMLEKEK